ncbi:MAG: hypothetical protein COB66_08660 [Coxiella sp. (in: Bacteria)]|nr:MAG: hypothetical protein COB66_08660 [Coxiella sp. (in: g-proteobacteria)]
MEYLKVNHVDTVIVGGLALDYCVKTTVLQLRDAEFSVIVNLSACRGIAADSTRQAIDDMKRSGATIATDCNDIQHFLKL